MRIRNAELCDIDAALKIYAGARAYMIATGNPNQWKDASYPDRELLEYDVSQRRLFVVVDNKKGAQDTEASQGTENAPLEEILCVFAFIIGRDPSYEVIEDGAWLNDEPYGTIHRLASSGKAGGVAHFLFDWCLTKIDNLRGDTHEENKIMQRVCESYGFKRCGIIHLKGAGDLYDGDPRIAYQYVKE